MSGGFSGPYEVLAGVMEGFQGTGGAALAAGGAYGAAADAEVSAFQLGQASLDQEIPPAFEDWI